MPWHAVQTKPGAESLALRGLIPIAARLLNPRKRVISYRQGRRLVFNHPYFPGYVFADLDQSMLFCAGRLAGVLRVLGSIPITDATIAEIAGQLDAAGFVIDPPIAPGDHRRIGISVLAGHLAEVQKIDSPRRARVLIAAFGRAVTVSLPQSWLDDRSSGAELAF